jgi:S-adenosylmethionine:tRNA ribosyltransferase-isomerase
MKLTDYDYNLPDERIAQVPPEVRGTTNLMVINRKSGEIEHKKYFNVIEYIKPGDVVVLNYTKVQSARAYFIHLNTGKRLEVLVLDKFDNGNYHCLIGKSQKVKDGDLLQDELNIGRPIKVVKRAEGVVGFEIETSKENMDRILEIEGHTPLPPYIKREDNEDDKERYNTVFAQKLGSSASPTASLNLTDELLVKLHDKGVKIAYVELKVGWGTFAPIRTDDVRDHQIHREYINLSKESADIINEVIDNGGDVWAFGTTVSRTLESCGEEKDGKYYVKPYEGFTQLYIYPGYEWKIVKHLVTNFHTPKSSLLVLVASFMGYDLMKEVYQLAIKKEYMFLSYGDSMLIL